MKKIVLTFCLVTVSLFGFEPKSIVDSICYACHGNFMQLKCYGVTKIVNELDENTIFKSLKEYKTGKNSAYGMGIVMRSQVESISDDDLKALSKYIPTLKQ